MFNLIVRSTSKFSSSSLAKRFLASQKSVNKIDNNVKNSDSLEIANVTNHLNIITQQTSSQSGRLFAIVWIAGSQYKVTTEDVILVRNSFYPTIGDRIRLEKVLLVGGRDFTVLGKPLVSKNVVRVEATVIEKTLSNDVIRFTYRARKDNRHWAYEKIQHTLLRINNIDIIGPLPQPAIAS